jgi:hypothetical protein
LIAFAQHRGNGGARDLNTLCKICMNALAVGRLGAQSNTQMVELKGGSLAHAGGEAPRL